MWVDAAPWLLKWNAGSWPAPPVQDANSGGWGAADTFGAAECEACCQLLLPPLLPVLRSGPVGSATVACESCGELSRPPPLACEAPVSTGSVAPIALAEAECDGCELPWPNVA